MTIASIDNFTQLLAARDVDFGWVVGVVIAILVAIFNAISAAAKKQEAKRREQVREALSNPSAPPMQQQPMLAENIRMRVPKDVLPRAAPKKSQPKKGTRPPAIPRQAPVAVVEQRSATAYATHQDISATEIRSTDSSSAGPAKAATADSIHRWMTPATLRQQFILTEILNKPKALRDD